MAEAGLQPKQISFVEAHGTGTQVGDTIEYESIRKVLGGPSRDDPLFLGAVKVCDLRFRTSRVVLSSLTCFPSDLLVLRLVLMALGTGRPH